MKKKLLSAVCALLILTVIASAFISAGAMSVNSGLDALRGQWSRSAGPSADGLALEYSYFCPKSSRPCPMFVFLGGAGEGTPSGKELEANDFAMWSGDEMQSRVFDADGMYIMILKAPEPMYFDTCPTGPMYSAITDFISKHNVDTSRITVGGWCLGASGASRLATQYPSLFSGLMLFSGRTVVTPSEARTLKDKRVWIFCSKADTYSVYATFTLPSWTNVAAATSDKNNVRLTTSDSAPRAALILNHLMWRLAEYDFSPSVLGQYSNLKTVDGYENVIANPTVINYMTMTKDGIAHNTAEDEATETEAATATDTQAATATDTAAATATDTAAETVTEETEPAADTPESQTEPVKKGKKSALPAVTGAACAAAVCMAAGAVVLKRKKRKG